ncbi:MAG: long-chain fatty acid--CoA ligase [Acidimicrobiaceae bacterium]|nr:long-chain fatty acid--CoA ligase [Acidimicrobiaceae bacterium]MYD06183.1 long-chain fatty acid--CoA ligase [Acidimicrobiaceae bacterium]MYI57429.1 long-chain fatty acid--CoA ligase [Acidimicrobiaceae bacterium]
MEVEAEINAEIDVDQTTGLVKRRSPLPYPIGPTTFAGLFDEPLRHFPERIGLIDNDRQWSFSELDRSVEQAAAALASLGVGPGDRVAWSLPNCAEVPIGFLATQRLAAVWLGINMNLAPPERTHLLNDSQASLWITADDATAASNSTAFKDTVISESEYNNAVSTADPTSAPHPNIDPHAPAAIAYTSGTTGAPKGAVHSQHNLLWPGLITLSTHPPKPTDRQGTPLAHTILNMLILGVISAWTRGTTGVVLHRGDPEGFCAEVKRHRLTRTTLVPAQLHDLVHHNGVDPGDLESLESILVGGAATPANTRRAFAEKFNIRALMGYGLSEAPTGIVRESIHEAIDDSATGYALDLAEVAIVDEDGHELPAGQTGEICLRPTTAGPWAQSWTPTLGYWRRPDATREMLRGNLLHTGDIGMLDSNKRLTVTGRRSELILRGGANVSPFDVEQVLLDHPEVLEAAVYGINDERLGERVAAAIVTATAEPDLAALRAFLADRLARYKIPDHISVLDRLPRNSMGKVLKSELPMPAYPLAD